MKGANGMMREESSQPKELRPRLSICIPTFNRAEYLSNCLESLRRAAIEHWENIEVIVSDNASTDNTEGVVKEYQRVFPISYFKNINNIGAEPNFFAAASHASAEHVWIFGDDDEFGDSALPEFLHYIEMGYDLILANFSSWSKDMNILIESAHLPWPSRMSYNNSNSVLSTFGINLGYISSVVVRKRILLASPPSEYERFIQYGFPHSYSIYCGLLSGCRVAYIPTPLFKRRADNSVGFMGTEGLSNWLKVVIEGTALIFEALERKGYSRSAVLRAKNRILEDYGVGIIISGITSFDRPKLRRVMFRHYRSSWRFWFMWLPALLLPASVLCATREAYRFVRNRAHSRSSTAGSG